MKSIYKIIFSSLILMGLMTSCFDNSWKKTYTIFFLQTTSTKRKQMRKLL